MNVKPTTLPPLLAWAIGVLMGAMLAEAIFIYTNKDWRDEAIANHAGHYTVNPTNGVVTWEWTGRTQP